MKLSKNLVVFGTLVVLFSGTLVYAYTSTVAESATITVNTACTFTTNTAMIAFAAANPGANDFTNVGLNVMNNGNVASNILVSGTSWTFGTNSFAVGNTLWSSTSLASYAGNALTGSNVDTHITIAAPNALTIQTSNVIYFGVAVPGGEPAGAWSQTVNVISQC